MGNKKTKACTGCGQQIDMNATVCPSCGAKNKKPLYARVWFGLLMVIVIVAIICVAAILLF